MEPTGYIPRHSGRPAAMPSGRAARMAVSVVAAAVMIGGGAAIAAAVSPRPATPACPAVSAGGGTGRGYGPCRARQGGLAGTTPAARVFARAGYGLRGPSAAVAAGGRLWVANVLGDSVTELSARTGAHRRTLAGDGLCGPNADRGARPAPVGGQCRGQFGNRGEYRDRATGADHFRRFRILQPVRAGAFGHAPVGGQCRRRLGHRDQCRERAADPRSGRVPVRLRQPRTRWRPPAGGCGWPTRAGGR